MSSNHTELIEVLRGFGGTHREAMGWLSEAADALQRQAEEAAIHHKNIERLDSIIHEQAAEIEALRADAVRYRWLRDKADFMRVSEGSPQVCLTDEWGELVSLGRDAYPQGARLDAAIDSAMQGVTG